MHITGKLLIFILLIPLAATSVWMSARLHVVRNSWAEKVDKLAVETIANADKIQQNKKKIQKLRNELNRTMLPWDRYWDNVSARGTINQGKILLNAQFGSNSGINSPDAKPVMHVFRPEANGKFAYLGPFVATTVQAKQSALGPIPSWKYRADDQLNLAPGKWRFRSLIPSGYSNRITQINTEIDKSDIKLRDYNITIVAQEKIIEDSDKALNDRLGELLGDPNAEELEGKPEFSKGLVFAIEAEQDSRNKTLNRLDIVRRQVKDEYDKMISLISENKQLASQLAGKAKPEVKATAQK